MSKKKEKKHVNHERWLISYADFITLLFAFFVVMYSISSVNEGKYKTMSESIEAAFHGIPTSLSPMVLPNSENHGLDFELKMSFKKAMMQLTENLSPELQEFFDKKSISITQTPDWVEIQLNSSVLFESASATLKSPAANLLKNIASALKPHPYFIRVEGFTDSIPIKNEYYCSNWDLSVARSSAVLRILEKNGVDSHRLSAIGYGEQFPIQDNRTPEGRSQNRRVSIVIERNDGRGKMLLENQFHPGPSDD